MATLLGDPPGAAPAGEQTSAAGADGAGPAPAGESRTCAQCGAPMQPSQDWCLQCGAGRPDSLARQSAGWHSWALAAAVGVLVLAAAAAAYAAWGPSSHKPRAATHLARTLAPAATATTPLPPTAPAATTPKAAAPSPVKPLLPRVKPPKIPLTAVTPKVPSTTPAASSAPESSNTTSSNTTSSATGATPSTSTSESSTGGGQAQPEAILLDTNAAATYNPYALPASNFGDPSLAIDGDTATGWTARVEAATAPKMAVGLVIDLNTSRKLSAVALTTSTPGMSIQLYGANGSAPAPSITAPAWVKLTGLLVAKTRHQKIALRDSTKAFKFVVLWISKAPASAVGTPTAPGHVSVNELELFPASK